MDRIAVSFSGGRTSGMMAHDLRKRKSSFSDMVFMFMNTGEEEERTLRFADRCDKEFDLNLVWLEAVINPESRAVTTHRVVNFETATRGGAIFEDMIAKYGIPNKNYPHCTRELKLRPFESYLQSIGWEDGTYRTAIGIRSDEIDRINPDFDRQRLYYPLCDAKIKKSDVFAFWDKQNFDLEIPEHRGNCVWCWKKSLRKHLTLARETPQVFKFPMRMEKEHGFSGAGEGRRVFFRDHMTAKEIIELSREPFERFIDARYLDQNGGCEESCEVHDPTPQMTFSFTEAAQ